jgi:hypothetical protein
MDWLSLKAQLLEQGTARIIGSDAYPYISSSTSGPGAGTSGSIFFSTGKGRVRLALDSESPVAIEFTKSKTVILTLDGQKIEGFLEPVALHCPRQAYITVTSGCVYRCKYCEVPVITAGRKKLLGMAVLLLVMFVALSFEAGVGFTQQKVPAGVSFSLPVAMTCPGQAPEGELVKILFNRIKTKVTMIPPWNRKISPETKR